MKKLLSIILAILMIATTVPFAFAADETPPTREIDGKTYYELDSADDLYWFAEQVNGGAVEINAILTDDIVVNENLLSEKLILTEKIENKDTDQGIAAIEAIKVCVAEVKTGEYVREWITMGRDMWDNSYSGHFNGNGKTISGLYANGLSFAGLFGCAQGCTIENLTLEDSYFYCERDTWAGAFVAYAEGSSAAPTYLKNLVNKSVVCGKKAGGGIVGLVQGTTHISGCINFGTIYPFAERYSSYNQYWGGGIAGRMLNTFSATNCVNLGNADYTFVSEQDSFTNCYYLDTASKGASLDTDNVIAVNAEELASGFVCEKIGGHRTEIVTAEPTCTEIGFEKIECLICEYSVMQKEFPALDHDIIIDADYVAPTCTETGLTEASHCTLCDDMTVAQEVIPANGHTPLEAVKENEVAPECEKAGSYDLVVYCDVCDEELDRDTVAVDALTHTDADGDYLCDNGCGHEFEKPAEPDTPDEPADDICDRCGLVHTNIFQKLICLLTDLMNRVIDMLIGIFI